MVIAVGNDDIRLGGRFCELAATAGLRAEP
jgi:hypothetical protein